MAEHEVNPEVNEDGDVEQLHTDKELQAAEGTADDVSTTSQRARRSQRVRTLTERGQEFHKELVEKAACRFRRHYEKWETAVKYAKGAIDDKYSEDLLQDYVSKVSNASEGMNAAYVELRSIESPDNETRRRMDTCEAITKTIIGAVAKCSNPSKSEVQRDEIWKETEPIYKLVASDKMSVKSHHTKLSSRSRGSSSSSSRLSVKRQDAAADVAANEAALQVLLEQETHMKEIERQEAEIAQRQRALEARRREVERLETIKKLNAAKARQQVYEQSECSDEEIYRLLHHSPAKNNEVKSENNDSHCKQCSSPQIVTPQREVNTTDVLIQCVLIQCYSFVDETLITEKHLKNTNLVS